MTASTLHTPRDARHLGTFSRWVLSFAAVLAAGTILLGGGWIQPQPLAWLLPVAAFLLGIGAVRAYVNFLRGADELLRKIHLEALALAFGAAMIAMPVYRLCERLGAPKLDVVDPMLVMALAWGAGQWIGLRRYSGGETE